MRAEAKKEATEAIAQAHEQADKLRATAQSESEQLVASAKRESEDQRRTLDLELSAKSEEHDSNLATCSRTSASF